MSEVCLLLALATPVLASAPAPTPRHGTSIDGKSARDLPGTHPNSGATCAATRAPSAPSATARVRRAFRPPQRFFTKHNQRAARVAIPLSLFPLTATPAAAFPHSLCRDSPAASNFSYSTCGFAPIFPDLPPAMVRGSLPLPRFTIGARVFLFATGTIAVRKSARTFLLAHLFLPPSFKAGSSPRARAARPGSPSSSTRVAPALIERGFRAMPDCS
jgi:hypothetical protein